MHWNLTRSWMSSSYYDEGLPPPSLLGIFCQPREARQLAVIRSSTLLFLKMTLLTVRDHCESVKHLLVSMTNPLSTLGNVEEPRKPRVRALVHPGHQPIVRRYLAPRPTRTVLAQVRFGMKLMLRARLHGSPGLRELEDRLLMQGMPQY